MNFSFFIAKRYFNTSKHKNFVHIISWVSLIAVAIGTAALIILLSVFNGFEDLILKMYNSFDPDLKITAFKGKVFNVDSIDISHNEIIEKAYVLEEKVLLKYNQKEFIATAKGVSNSYKNLTKFDDLLVNGRYIDSTKNTSTSVVGQGVAYYLSMGFGSILDHLKIFVPNRSAKTLLNPQTAFTQGSAIPVGIFSVQADLDRQYIITNLDFLQNLTDRKNLISAIEIKVKNLHKVNEIKDYLQERLGTDFEVKNRVQQQDFLYKILNTEKLAVFLILLLILIISTFNIIGSLTMLMIDKRNDILTYKSFGVTKNQIESIFFKKSMLTVLSGLLLGLFFGLGFSLLQYKFGFISMGSGSFMVESYPVSVKILDIFFVIITVVVIGLLASWYPVKILSKKIFDN